MKKMTGILLVMLMIGSGCEDPLDSGDTKTVRLRVTDMNLPDTVKYGDQVDVGVEVVLFNSGYRYVGPFVFPSETGCDIWIFGEKASGIVLCVVGYEWHTISVILERRGEFIVRAIYGDEVTWADTMYVE